MVLCCNMYSNGCKIYYKWNKSMVQIIIIIAVYYFINFIIALWTYNLKLKLYVNADMLEIDVYNNIPDEYQDILYKFIELVKWYSAIEQITDYIDLVFFCEYHNNSRWLEEYAKNKNAVLPPDKPVKVMPYYPKYYHFIVKHFKNTASNRGERSELEVYLTKGYKREYYKIKNHEINKQ